MMYFFMTEIFFSIISFFVLVLFGQITFLFLPIIGFFIGITLLFIYFYMKSDVDHIK